MEIRFENKEQSVWREAFRQSKRSRESLESVVPDVSEDIGRVASVQSRVLLKSKDMTERGAELTGELIVSLLYITEGEDAAASLQLSKDFRMEFELPEHGVEAFPAAELTVLSAEARVLNPRKVAVTVELGGELRVYQQEKCTVASYLPEGDWPGLYCRVEQAEATPIRTVGEKSFAVHEQFLFPADSPAPEKLVSQRLRLQVDEVQQIGSRSIAKGRMELELCYLSPEALPCRCRFQSSFSQILESGGENSCAVLALVQETSAYYDLIDTIGGEKALDTEVHAVMQLISRSRETVSVITDAYSNRRPLQFETEARSFPLASEPQTAALSGEEKLELSEDCAQLLFAWPTLGQAVSDREALRCNLSLELIYRTADGSLAAARRSLELSGPRLGEDCRILSVQAGEPELKREGTALQCKATAEVKFQKRETVELDAISAVSAEDGADYDAAALPGLTLVRVDDEDLWELAKRYHSSVALITETNEQTAADPRGKLLLIPRE